MWKKKLLAAALAAGLALSLGTGAAAAALTGRNYVDGNGDGICDNRADGGHHGGGHHGWGRGCRN